MGKYLLPGRQPKEFFDSYLVPRCLSRASIIVICSACSGKQNEAEGSAVECALTSRYAYLILDLEQLSIPEMRA